MFESNFLAPFDCVTFLLRFSCIKRGSIPHEREMSFIINSNIKEHAHA